MTKLKLREGDTVQMLAGKDRGKQGRIIRALPGEGKVVVENLNVQKKHQKPRPIRDGSRMGGTQIAPGGIIDRPAAVSTSNVMLVCPTCKLPTRVGYAFRVGKDGEQIKVRVCKREGCGQELDK